jgi:outer membrane protein OmpA-like peptidoglycan-associated protein
VNGIEAGDKVVINGETRTVQSITDNTTGTSTIDLTSALPSAPVAGVTVAEQKIVTAAVTAGTIIQTGIDVTVSATITATSVSSSVATTTSGAILNTFNSGAAGLVKYVRNVTTSSAGTGTAYSYNSINYYPAGVAAKPGDILEYILVSSNIGSGTVSASVVTDVLPISYVTPKTGAYYSGIKDITYVDENNTAHYLTYSEQGSYTAPALTVNVGTGATNATGGTIPSGKTVLVLYQVTVDNNVQGDKIVNNARISSPDITTVTSAVTVATVIRTASVLELFIYAPSFPGAELVNLSQSAYRTGSAPADPFISYTSNPVPVGSTTPIDLNQPVPLISATQLHQGEPLFFRLTDLDQNLDRTIKETVILTISNPANGDVDVIRLTETGLDTGVFTGYLLTAGIPPALVNYNGSLSFNAGDRLNADYVDIADNSDHPPAETILVDPFGVVLDSSTGLPVSSAATITIQTATGAPATVYGDDGVSIYPSTVTTGGTVQDSSGKSYTFPSGSYRFPFLKLGNYKFMITPPAGYGYPSTVATTTIQSLPGGPFEIVDGSRGETFVIQAGPALRIDIPVDSSSSTLWLQKAAGKDFAGHGDFIPYRLTLTNGNLSAAGSVIAVDKLPIGFRLRGGSVKINGVPVSNPSISADGRTLTFIVGTVAANSTTTIDYVVEVTAGTKLGKAINSAIASSNAGSSNKTSATVTIRDDFLRTRSTLMGRVSTGACDNKTGEGPDGVEGVRVYLEDGSFVISDKRGLFHFEGVRSGLHVVQMDLDSLPEGYEAFACTQNSRFAGRSFSQFVETQGGALGRTDFHIRKKQAEKVPVVPPVKGEIALQLANAIEKDFITYKVSMRGTTLPVKAARLNVILPEEVLYNQGSSMMDGAAIADPQKTDKTKLIFKLNDLPADWSREITFRAAPSKEVKAGSLVTQAYLAADGDGKAEVLTPPAETVLQLNKNEKIFQMPDIILRPHFSIRSAELNAEDRKKLDEIAKSLSGLRTESIRVTGYTDNMPIAPKNRIYYTDNQALSLDRARSVGHYIMNKLNIPPEKLFIEGKGSDNPVADNRTEAGRAQNRRVELHINSSRATDYSTLSVVKKISGEKRKEIASAIAQSKLIEPQVPASATPDKSDITIKEKEGILYPDDNEILANKTSGVRICLNSRLTPRLLVDDKEVPVKQIGFTMKDEKAGKAIYSYIGVDFGKTGKHTVQLQGIDPFGNARFQQTISIKRSGEIVSIRFKSAQGNVADGKTPVKLKLDLYDADGTIIPAATELEIREGTLSSLKQPDIFAAPPTAGSHPRVQMSREGYVLFQPVNQSGLYRVVLGYNNINVEAETYVQPQLRDWILVGLAEGTVGYNTVSGNMENLQGAGAEENLYKDSRVAFYAKGKIKGKWLLTMAYDSAKSRGYDTNGLFQTINPETYYTLYGDTSQQQYDAASSRNLYIKIEREQFYAMFGDYDTGLTVTELSRYSRRMTGVKTELQTKNFEVNAFASETEQVYKRDEIPGDGTSGIYRLSGNNIILGSEKITIEVRDRFRSEVLVSSRLLNRFTDYSIDYDAGNIIFKEPIYSRDEKFNPIIIVAEYETISSGGKDYTYGGRAGAKLLDNKLKAGGSYVHEGQGDRSSNLYGADASVKLDDNTKLRGEIAKSEYSAGSSSRSGKAYLGEVSRTTKKYDAKAYYREQEEGFGLGQQPGSEAGTRKLGAEGAYRFNEIINASANVYRQYNLMTDATRDMAEGKFGYSEKNYGASVGFLHANDSLSDGSKRESNQLTLGGKVRTLYDRLTLGLNHAQSIGSNDNSDFPTRTTLSAEYAATRNLTLIAAQEFTWGSGGNTQNTRIGMRSSPWSGANITSSVERQFNENDERVFANVGLKQTVQVNKDWKVDAGVERSQTVAKSEHYQFNTNVQPSSGSHEDFTAVSGGATYQIKNITWDNRVEFRLAESENKWGLMSGLVKEVNSNWALSARLQYFQTSAVSGMSTVKADLRQGLVYRPPQTKFIALNRLDFIIDNQSGSGTSFDSWRLVNNFITNYRPRKDMQLSLHYGAKYVQEKINETDYSGYTDLIGAEGRYDINKDWDVGLQGSILHSWDSGQLDYSGGVSVGYNMMQNIWISLGYNFTGFNDKDFSQADYTAQGPFVRFRLKFDQNSVQDAAKWINGN